MCTGHRAGSIASSRFSVRRERASDAAQTHAAPDVARCRCPAWSSAKPGRTAVAASGPHRRIGPGLRCRRGRHALRLGHRRRRPPGASRGLRASALMLFSAPWVRCGGSSAAAQSWRRPSSAPAGNDLRHWMRPAPTPRLTSGFKAVTRATPSRRSTTAPFLFICASALLDGLMATVYCDLCLQRPGQSARADRHDLRDDPD